MNHLFTLAALDLAHERAREAERAHRDAKAIAAARSTDPGRPGAIRRALADGLALVSRGSAAAARWIRADDLGSERT